MSTVSSDWVVGHPSENKSFVTTVVIASLFIVAFFVGTGFMLYFWVKSWRGKDNYGSNVSRGGTENKKVTDLEAQRSRPATPPPDNHESDESPIVEVSRWRQETISASSQASSARTSSEMSVNDHNPERPRS